MNESDWVIVTAGNQLCIDVLDQLSQQGNVSLKAVIFDRETDKWRKPFLQTISNVYRYEGFWGLFRRITKSTSSVAGLARKTTAAPSYLEQIRDRCAVLGAEFFVVNDINSAQCEKFLQDRLFTYGMVIGTGIIKSHIFSRVKKFMVNIHQGKIPEYRGGGIVFWSLYNGTSSFSITTHLVANDVDSGDVLAEKEIDYAYDFGRFGLNYPDYIVAVGQLLHQHSIGLIVGTMQNIEAYYQQRRIPQLSQANRYRKPTYKQKQQLVAKLKARYRSD